MSFRSEALAGDAELLSELGDAAAYRPRGGAAATVQGLFERDYVESQGVEGFAPVFRCLTSAVSTAGQGDELVHGGTTYVVRSVQPDGMGMTTLILQER